MLRCAPAYFASNSSWWHLRQAATPAWLMGLAISRSTVAAWCGFAENIDSGRITKRSNRTAPTIKASTAPSRFTCSGNFTLQPSAQ